MVVGVVIVPLIMPDILLRCTKVWCLGILIHIASWRKILFAKNCLEITIFLRNKLLHIILLDLALFLSWLHNCIVFEHVFKELFVFIPFFLFLLHAPLFFLLMFLFFVGKEHPTPALALDFIVLLDIAKLFAGMLFFLILVG